MTNRIPIRETWPLACVSPTSVDGLSSFTTTLSNEIDNRDKSLRVAVSQISAPWSVWNITSAYKNNKLAYSTDNGVTGKVITLASGMYVFFYIAK